MLLFPNLITYAVADSIMCNLYANLPYDSVDIANAPQFGALGHIKNLRATQV